MISWIFRLVWTIRSAKTANGQWSRDFSLLQYCTIRAVLRPLTDYWGREGQRYSIDPISNTGSADPLNPTAPPPLSPTTMPLVTYLVSNSGLLFLHVAGSRCLSFTVSLPADQRNSFVLLRLWTLTCESDLDTVKMNHGAKNLGQRSFRSPREHTYDSPTAIHGPQNGRQLNTKIQQCAAAAAAALWDTSSGRT